MTTIRRAVKEDFDALYKLGKRTPELSVMANGEFMEEDEFLNAIETPSGVFLLAESEGVVSGFIYTNRLDPDRPLKTRWACLVYLAVDPAFRRQGIAQELYNACVAILKEQGVNHLYGWANIESDGSIVRFLEREGFAPGHKYMWMDKKL